MRRVEKFNNNVECVKPEDPQNPESGCIKCEI